MFSVSQPKKDRRNQVKMSKKIWNLASTGSQSINRIYKLVNDIETNFTRESKASWAFMSRNDDNYFYISKNSVIDFCSMSLSRLSHFSLCSNVTVHMSINRRYCDTTCVCRIHTVPSPHRSHFIHPLDDPSHCLWSR